MSLMDKQLLPKDLLNHARKIPRDEGEQQILNAIKNLKNSQYSHGITTFGNPWVNLPTGTSMIGTTSTAASGVAWSSNSYYFTSL